MSPLGSGYRPDTMRLSEKSVLCRAWVGPPGSFWTELLRFLNSSTFRGVDGFAKSKTNAGHQKTGLKHLGHGKKNLQAFLQCVNFK